MNKNNRKTKKCPRQKKEYEKLPPDSLSSPCNAQSQDYSFCHLINYEIGL